MSVKLIAVDMDGTFLNDEMKYDKERFLKQYLKMKALGIKFVVASGNQYYQLISYFPEIKDEISFVSENGALIVSEGKLLSCAKLNKEDTHHMIDVLESIVNHEFVMCGEKSAYVHTDISKKAYDIIALYYYRLQKVDNLYDVDDKIFKFCFDLPYQQMDFHVDKWAKETKGIMVPVSTGHTGIDFIIPGVHKANGIKRLQGLWDIKDDEVAAFGDSGNDIEMLRHAKYSYAMENANNKEVKEIASAIIGSNNEDGVLNQIDVLLEMQENHMIQDIAPRHLYNEYQKVEADSKDYIIYFEGGKILCEQGEVLLLPRFKDLEAYNKDIYDNDIFLFRMGDKNYFLVHDLIYPKDKQYKLSDIRTFMSESKQHKGFAAVTAFQLYNWYERHHYCGKCGQPFTHAENERRLYCTHCGNEEYPKVAPAVIVGIKNQDKLLLTKYQGREYSRYALVAGYCEIGETVEETVIREVNEEVGIHIKNIRYYKCQPWGLSETLLFGFYADLDGDETITLDQNELAVGVWVKRSDIEDDISPMSLTGEMIQRFKDGLE